MRLVTSIYHVKLIFQIAAPSPQVMEEVKNIMRRMQQHYSPLKKVESMLKGIGIILKTQRAASPDMDNNPKIPAIDRKFFSF